MATVPPACICVYDILAAIPLVITPVTLSVQLTKLPAQPFPTTVPNVDFTSLNFANVPFSTSRRGFVYSRPQNTVLKVVYATSATSNIIPIIPPTTNSSWTLDFHGPELKCSPAPETLRNAINSNVESALRLEDCTTSLGYLCWGPTGGSDSQSVPFHQDDLGNITLALQDKLLAEFGRDGSEPYNGSPSRAVFFMAVFPHIVNEIQTTFCDDDLLGPNGQLADSTILQCELYNSTYHVDFNFVNGEQLINITMGETLNIVDPILFPGTSRFIFTDSSESSPNFTQAEALAYQSVFDAFGRSLVGSVSSSVDTSGALTVNTSILVTTLSETKELAFLSKWEDAPAPGSFTDLQSFVELSGDFLKFPGTSVVDNANYSRPLDKAMEDMFRNITIGLMSSQLLQ
ncbi:hypothetical protein HD806DRAFT_305268 [Xylariaceae sp. AK1471]|nr:hypothetical protein HD806DRAFT_305268 [Xylariaceae sp. AK1471]